MITIRVEKGYVWQMSVVKPKAFPLRARSKQNFISSTANVIFFSFTNYYHYSEHKKLDVWIRGQLRTPIKSNIASNEQHEFARKCTNIKLKLGFVYLTFSHTEFGSRIAKSMAVYSEAITKESSQQDSAARKKEPDPYFELDMCFFSLF